ncbi:MAG: hypothetical protein PW788_00565 [Micavibrio sp.]|nr:hypothetical protein [Micavibrio sp.]
MTRPVTALSPAGDHNAELDFSVGAVSWPAIIAGGVATIAISLLLTLFGAGLGLSFTSPWSNAGISGVAFTINAAIWLIIVQWAASAFGGYIAGRLRTRWTRVHTDEVFFRDTAHGFLSWALAAVFTVAFLTSAVASVIGGGARMAGPMASAGAATSAMSAPAKPGPGMMAGPDNGPFAYYVDGLYRGGKTSAVDPEARGETTRILLNSLKSDNMPDADRDYLAKAVETRAGVSHEEALRRVTDAEAGLRDMETKTKEAADAARKSAASFAFFTFFSMLIGAFISSVAAAIGGSQRDAY